MKKQNDKPTRSDILKVIADIDAGVWLDPTGIENTLHWCNLFNPRGVYVMDGVGYTPSEAAAYAWISAWSPDALINNHVGNIPLDIEDGWKFELGQPGEPWHRPALNNNKRLLKFQSWPAASAAGHSVRSCTVSNCLDGELERLIDHVLDEAGDGLHRSKKIGLSRDEIELILADARSRLVSDLHCRHGDWRNVVRAFDALIQQASEGRQR